MELVQKIITRFFKRRSKVKLYACHHGDYVGQMMAVVGRSDKHVNVLLMPNMENISISIRDFDRGVSTEIIEVVNEEMPKEVQETIRKQYEKNASN